MNVNSVKTRVIIPISDCQRVQQKLRKGIAVFCSQPNRAQLSRREIQRGIGDAAPTSELAKRIVFVFKGTMPSLPVFANGGPAALLANAHSGALFALFASFSIPFRHPKTVPLKQRKGTGGFSVLDSERRAEREAIAHAWRGIPYPIKHRRGVALTSGKIFGGSGGRPPTSAF